MSDWTHRPILVTGMPRSGTSLTARALALMGAWTGPTRVGDERNPYGYYENDYITKATTFGVVKGTSALDYVDPHLYAQDPDWKRSMAQMFRGRALSIIRSQGYEDGSPWLYKHPSINIVWELWRMAFPSARWVITNRPVENTNGAIFRYYKGRHSGSIILGGTTRLWRRRAELVTHLSENKVPFTLVNPQSMARFNHDINDALLMGGLFRSVTKEMVGDIWDEGRMQ